MSISRIRSCQPAILFVWIGVATMSAAGQQPTFRSGEPGAGRAKTAAHGGDRAIVSMLPAIVEPVQLVNMSVPNDGLLMRIDVGEGDQVAGGQILAQLDNRIALASVKVAETMTRRAASLEGAQSALASARRRLDRLTRLDGAVSGDELDQARDALAQAESNLELVREQHREALVQLELEQARLDGLNIRAPFDGVIVRIDAQPGQTMTRSDALLTIANMRRLKADLHLPVSRYGAIRVGDLCELKADAPVDSIVRGTIVSVEPRMDAATRTFRCQVEIDNADRRLPAGFSVHLVAPATDQPATPVSFPNR